MNAPRLLAFSLLFAAGPLCAPLCGQSAGPLVLPSNLLEEVHPAPPLRLAEEPLARPLAELPAAALAAQKELRDVQEWNDAGRQPVRIGIQRALPAARRVEIAATPQTTAPAEGEILAHAGGLLAAQAGTVVWGGGVRVEEGWRLRLHLSGVRLPQGARMWVYGSDGELVGPFGAELRDPEGGLWTPSVGGPEIRLEIELPAGSTAGAIARFTIDRVAEILPSGLRLVVAADQTCFVDGRCVDRNQFPGVDLVRKAVALLVTPAGPGFVSICTGGLLNDTDSRTVVPYLLTAHHCIDNQVDAAAVEAFFDYMPAQCNGPAPSLARLPRGTGGSLVATGTSSDFSLLRLARIPTGRTLLGWSAAPVGNGTRLFRLSHPVNEGSSPVIWPQMFAETVVDEGLQQSGQRPRSRYIYARQVTGGMWEGSSGSPVVLSNGQVVGQLFGAIGSELPEACDFRSAIVDGALSSSFASLRPFLDPPAPCKPGPDTLCLLNNRFRVRVSWQNQFDGTSGVGRPIPRSNVTGFFSFGDPSNVELLVKILDFGDVVKVFWGQLTNLRYTLEVTDTATGRTQNYTNTPGDCGGIDQDFAASVAPAPTVKSAPLGKAAACRPGSSTLCLLKSRFAVEVSWRNPANGTSGLGGAAALSNVTGTFTFGDRSNVELMVKLLDFGDRIAFFWGALSDLDYTIRVTDTATGTVKTYQSRPGTLCGGLDNDAF